ncbi:Two-component sensor histidine kinase, contains HisKA and HATPase domains [Loktanella sp. DSM 29012]|uniref:sensor histidine kinase n=1 Tax=Loktanella sp. DSM 29012 TaxID=1881056 RepID=UPI0008C41845|nr:HWE histidine kinase domain-containing protein [Loktanella sp. DSM 29012]SEQ45409.1 Two-component sensor histidine kinase, contains HisKA and HATPase domains [Loktanella sp. DSM 29012]
MPPPDGLFDLPVAGQPDVSAALLQLGVQVAGLGLGTVDYVNDTITLDARAAELFDLPALRPVSRDELHARIHPEDQPHVQHEVDALLAPGQPDIVDVVHRVPRPDGGHRWLSARKQVTFKQDADGNARPVSGLVAIMDISALKSHEDHVVALMGEMNHRLKNVLTIVQSIARLTARTTEPQDFLASFNARMAALGQNQNLLMQQAAVGVQLGDLVREQLSPFASRTDPRITVDGPALILRESAMQSIGLTLHELATNATKYGALSVSEGRLTVSWTVTDETLSLSWREDGGPSVKAPEHRGFGTSVLQTMTEAALNATVTQDFDPKGLRWSMTCPVQAINDTNPPR